MPISLFDARRASSVSSPSSDKKYPYIPSPTTTKSKEMTKISTHSSCPVQKLPGELLVRIFELYLSHEKYRESSDEDTSEDEIFWCPQPSSVFVLSHVCSDWLRVTTQTPSFWTRIRVTIKPGLRFFLQKTTLFIKRAKGCPIDLNVTILDPSPPLPASKDRNSTSSSDGLGVIAEMMITTMLHYISQWRHISFHIFAPALLPSLFKLPSSPHLNLKPENLRAFKVCYYPTGTIRPTSIRDMRNPLSSYDFPFLREAPMLERVHLTIPNPYARHISQWHDRGTTNSSNGSLDPTEEQIIATLLQVNQNANDPFLTSLANAIAASMTTPPPANWDSLRAIRIDSQARAHQCLEVLRSFPNLYSVHFRLYHFWELSGLDTEFQDVTHTSLRHFSLAISQPPQQHRRRGGRGMAGAGALGNPPYHIHNRSLYQNRSIAALYATLFLNTLTLPNLTSIELDGVTELEIGCLGVVMGRSQCRELTKLRIGCAMLAGSPSSLVYSINRLAHLESLEGVKELSLFVEPMGPFARGPSVRGRRRGGQGQGIVIGGGGQVIHIGHHGGGNTNLNPTSPLNHVPNPPTTTTPATTTIPPTAPTRRGWWRTLIPRLLQQRTATTMANNGYIHYRINADEGSPDDLIVRHVLVSPNAFPGLEYLGIGGVNIRVESLMMLLGNRRDVDRGKRGRGGASVDDGTRTGGIRRIDVVGWESKKVRECLERLRVEDERHGGESRLAMRERVKFF